MKKRICTLLVVMVMLLASTVSYAAAPPTVEPMGTVCSCGGHMQQYGSKQYSAWTLTSKTRSCQHGKSGTDAQYKRQVTTNLKCTSCGRTSYMIGYEYKWECKGYV